MAELFGFEFKRKEKELPSFIPKQEDDGAIVVEGAGVYGTFLDVDGSLKTEAELVSKYREIAEFPELEEAIDDIVNEAIVLDSEDEVVELVLDDLKQSDNIKKLITDEFKNVLTLLEFNQYSYELFKKWYIDGRLYYHVIIDESAPKEGIQELRYIDPRKIRKIRQIKKKKGVNSVPSSETQQEYFIYSDKGFSKVSNSITSSNSINGIKIAKDSIIHCTSGKTTPNSDLVISYLHKAIRPFNQLRLMEDALVIYRISRAPERRVFYVDVGDLPKMKAEQYLRDVMNRFKNKLVYDSSTGEMRNGPKYMTMLEDFWLPRRAGGRATEITTLPGGMNLGQLDDVTYFQNKLYKSLNVPITRLNPEVNFNLGRSTEITRDEIKFSKFIARLRGKFSMLFLKILEKQLILKGIITPEDWDEFKNCMKFKFSQDNYYEELKETEIMRERISMLRDIDDYAGKYYSHEQIRKKILRQTDDDIKLNDKEIAQELNNPQYNPPEPEPDPEPEPAPAPAPVTNKFIIGGKDASVKQQK